VTKPLIFAKACDTRHPPKNDFPDTLLPRDTICNYDNRDMTIDSNTTNGFGGGLSWNSFIMRDYDFGKDVIISQICVGVFMVLGVQASHKSPPQTKLDSNYLQSY